MDEDASIPVAYYSFLHVSFADILDDWSLDAIESSTLSEQGVESSQEFAKVTHEEACILVDGDELHFIAQKEGKCRPYKVLSLSRFLCLFLSLFAVASNWKYCSEEDSGSLFFKNEVSKEAGV